MRLAARMALHAAAWQSAPSPAWHPGARAGAWEHGAMDAPGRAEATDEAAVGDGRRAREAWAGEGTPTIAAREDEARPSRDLSPSSGWERGALEVPAREVDPRASLETSSSSGWGRGALEVPARPSIDASQVRGSAWSHGAYRLFVRGRAVRAATPEIMPCFEPVRARAVAPMSVSVAARGVEAVRVRVLSPIHVQARALAPVSAEAMHVESVLAPRSVSVEGKHVEPVVEARRVAPIRALALAPMPGTVEPGRVEFVHSKARPVAAEAGSLHVEPSLVAAEDGVVRRVVEWPLTGGERPAVLGGALARLVVPDAAAWRALVPQLAGVPMPGEGGSPAVFLDVETTALDRGAGALAFMIGVAAFVGGALRVEQWILAKLSAEPVMLAEVVERVAALAGPGAVLASYNGASFDVPLLRTRLQRARQFARVEPLRSGLERPHVDLLHPARRMWQGRDRDCRLGTLERTRLGVRRVHDLAGHEIPAVFWAWLRRPGDADVQALMQRAADHNLADLVVLPALGAALGRCLTAPEDLEGAVRAAQHLVTCGRRDQALALLASWHARSGPAPLRRRALLLAADLLRRDGGTGAPALWSEVCRISPGDPAAHEALAKHLEHRVGDLEQALTVARGSAAPCLRRVARLERKLGVPPAN